MSDDNLHLIEKLAEEYLQQKREGVAEPLGQFVARHAEFADELRDFIEALQIVNDLKKGPDKRPEKAWPAPAPDELPQIEDYRIDRELGRGAMGIVYEAQQLSLGRRVALKTMLPGVHGGERESQRFMHEARTAAKLTHPAIVPVYDVGESNGTLFYAMQYIEGRGLDRVARSAFEILNAKSQPGTSVEEGLANWLVTGTKSESLDSERLTKTDASATATPSTVKATTFGNSTKADRSGQHYRRYYQQIAQIGQQVAEALAFAHDRAVIHRDIKPANLLLDLDGKVWVADFGLVKTDDHELTQTGAFVGTLRYMAPERFQGECDVRSDVYSLGVTLYELLALRPALQSTDQLSLLQQIRDTDPAPLRTLERRIPRDLEVIVSRTIQKDPRRRYATAHELADDLTCFLEGRPIRAREVSRLERAMIWARRNPVVSSLLTLLLVGLLATVVGSVWAAFAFRDIADVATESQRITESTLARSNYYLSWARWEENRCAQAIDYLDQIPAEYRNIEWTLAKNTFQGARLTLDPSTRKVAAVRLSPDGSKLISANVEKTISVHDCKTGSLMSRFALDSEPFSLAVSPNGSRIASGDVDGRVTLWDVESEDQVWLYDKRDNVIKDLRFSPDGTKLAIAEGSGRVTLLDTETGESLWSEKGHGNDANSVAFHPSGKYFVSVGPDRTIKFWRTSDGKVLSAISALADMGSLQTVAFNPNGQGIAIGSRGGTVRSFLVHQNTNRQTTGEAQFVVEPAEFMRGHQSPIVELVFCSDGARLVTASQDSTMRIWRVGTGEEIKRLRVRAGAVESIDVAENGYQIASAGLTDVNLWDVRRVGSHATYRNHRSSVRELRFDSEGTELLTSSETGIRLWNAASLSDIQTFEWNEAKTSVAVFSPDGQKVVASSNDGKG